MSSRILQLTFACWELANHRDLQEKLRAEINDTLSEIRARGDTDFTANDFEKMPYLAAITKVRRDNLFVSLYTDEILLTPCVGNFESSSHLCRNWANGYTR